MREIAEAEVAMLGEVFQRFVEKSPIAVMVRGVLERVLGAEALDAWYEQTAQKQYTRALLFSTIYELMSAVVFAIKPSVHAAYQGREAEVGASVVSVYNKLKGVEPQTSAELVRYSAQGLTPIIDQLEGSRAPWLPGYRVKILDGNCLEATEPRLKELRTLSAGALPGKSLVVFDPALGLVVDVFPCEDGYAQERSLLGEVLPTVQAGEVWLQDRNFCTRDFLCGIAARESFFITREHQKLSWEALSRFGPARRIETGKVAEQRVCVRDRAGNAYTFRRIRLELDEPRRDGEWVIYILTNLPRQAASAKTVARLYGKRWTIETAFQELEGHLHSEINTLGYPQAALFGFCVALVAYNAMAVVFAALRSVHGAEKIDQEVSGYYIANEIAETYRGLNIAIPEPHWRVFVSMSAAEFASTLQQLASKVHLRAFRKHPRGPKKPPPKRYSSAQQPHVSTARLLLARKAASNAP
jgi:IS4 transposase